MATYGNRHKVKEKFTVSKTINISVFEKGSVFLDRREAVTTAYATVLFIMYANFHNLAKHSKLLDVLMHYPMYLIKCLNQILYFCSSFQFYLKFFKNHAAGIEMDLFAQQTVCFNSFNESLHIVTDLKRNGLNIIYILYILLITRGLLYSFLLISKAVKIFKRFCSIVGACL